MGIALSIIVPVYNVEIYLSQCIESISHQNFTNYELILVNDGSTDQSGIICDNYAKINKRIKVIHQNNGGVSAARNAGLDIARGDFIAFIDSDDWIEPDMYETLLQNVGDNHVDVAICSFINDGGKINSKKKVTSNKVVIMNSEDAINSILQGTPFGGYVWNKIYRREKFGDLRFLDMKVAEDALFTWNLLHLSKKICYNEGQKYHYRKRVGSLCTSEFSMKNLDELKAREMIYENTARYYPSLEERAFARFIQCSIQIGVNLVSADILYKEKFLEMQQLWKHNSERIKDNKILKKRFKKHLYLMSMPYNICRKFYLMRKINRRIIDLINLKSV